MSKKINIIVRLKAGVLDPEGKTVKHALHSLDFGEVAGVRVGKFIELEVDETGGRANVEARIQAMCDKLLANPVIEDYEIQGV